jgi:dephospho-CoA kinase
LPPISPRPVLPRPFLIGLTGGIGAGKSTAAARFAELNIPVIDTDEIAHALTAPGGAAMNSIRNTFGLQMVNQDGALNRVAMRALVFTDAQAKEKLESILHPLIRSECLARIEGAMKAAPEAPPYIMLAVPLLFEAMSFRAMISRSLLVDCPVAIQIERVARRPGMSEAQAMRIVAVQIARPLRLQLADDVLVNSADPDAIDAPIRALDALYRSLAMGGGRA